MLEINPRGKYIAKSRIRHGGVVFGKPVETTIEPGTRFDMDDDTVEPLLEAGVAERAK